LTNLTGQSGITLVKSVPVKPTLATTPLGAKAGAPVE
jgi:hypothetical protein